MVCIVWPGAGAVMLWMLNVSGSVEAGAGSLEVTGGEAVLSGTWSGSEEGGGVATVELISWGLLTGLRDLSLSLSGVTEGSLRLSSVNRSCA